MVIKKLKVCAYASALAFATLYNSFAGGFTTAKGTYDFATEYSGTFHDNSEGKSNKVYAQGVEINNDFGIAEDQSLGLDLFFDKSHSLNDSFEESSKLSTAWKHAFQVRHKMNFNLNKSINFGLQNALFIKEITDNAKPDAYSKRWELRGMVRHDSDAGFYKHSRMELSYRRNFKFNNPDVFRIDLRTEFRVFENVDFLVKVETYFLFASQGYLNNNPDAVKEERVNHYSFGSLKASEVVLFTGPEFSLPNGDSIYIHYTMQLDASNDNRNHAKGFAIGYSRSIDLN